MAARSEHAKRLTTPSGGSLAWADQPGETNALLDGAAGAIGGIVSTIAMYPINIATTRLQVSQGTFVPVCCAGDPSYGFLA